MLSSFPSQQVCPEHFFSFFFETRRQWMTLSRVEMENLGFQVITIAWQRSLGITKATAALEVGLLFLPSRDFATGILINENNPEFTTFIQCLKIAGKVSLFLQHCERNELSLHFEWTKLHKKNTENGLFRRFFFEKLKIAVQQCF